MKLFENLKRVTSELAAWPDCWAICGGIAACIYRAEPRYTGDIDIALIDGNGTTAREIADRVARSLKVKTALGFVTDQHKKLISEPALIVVRNDEAGSYVGIDFLLPVLPWIRPAVERAQANRLDYGFAMIPTIPPEDLILAKGFALQGSPERPYDLDDMISILKNNPLLDQSYILTKASELGIEFPDQILRRLKNRD